MTECFNDRLARIVTARKTNLCVGLDPDWDLVRARLHGVVLERLRAQPISFGFVTTDGPPPDDAQMPGIEQLADEPDIAKEVAAELVLEATRAEAAAFKPNAAFFELVVAGGSGVLDAARAPGEETLVIFDAKRGDIGNTSAQYAQAIFGDHGYDAVTVNPLMGGDSVEPFLRDGARGAFVLCLTSNPGADDFLLRNDLYKRIAEKAVEWNRLGNVGLVVGATRPEQAAQVRAIAPDLPLLVPGVGAQGGALAETIDAIGGRTNPRFLINASRSIMFAEPRDGEGPLQAAARAARDLRQAIAAAMA